MNEIPAQKTKRLSPYRRVTSAFPSLVLKARDHEILLLLHQYRFLTTDLIWRLIGIDDCGPLDYGLGEDGRRRPKTYGFGQAALYKRLHALFHAGYLDRHFVSDQPIGGSHGSPRAIYGLGPKAAPVVAELAGITSQEVRRVIEANKVKSPFLKHALGIATFHVILNQACLESRGRVAITHWEQGSRLADYIEATNADGVTHRFSVYPDAFFALSVAGKGVSHFMFELDRGTMPIISKTSKPDLRKKFIGYRLYRESGKFKKRYGYTSRPDGSLAQLDILSAERKVVSTAPVTPISGFSVLFLIPGAVMSNGSTTGRLANVISTVASFGAQYATSALFWFAPLDAFQLDRPQSVFDALWITPNPTRGRLSLIQ